MKKAGGNMSFFSVTISGCKIYMYVKDVRVI